ncbi:MAG: serine/threonine-protein kinase [Dehalococcoidia bacterium]
MSDLIVPDSPGPELKAPDQISHYRLDEVVGRGAMGTVYRATDVRTDSTVAVKLLHAQADDDAEHSRFIREAHVASLLRSPYTVHVLDYGIEDGRFFLVMPFVDGQTVAEEMAAGPIKLTRGLRLAAQVARALEEAETRGVVHRDIKPDNIIVSSRGVARVLDFGISRHAAGSDVAATGAYLGTPLYASPEAARGQTDHRSDIYSLGVSLYHMLVGEPPFTGDPMELMTHHEKTPVPLEPLEGLPQAVIAVITGCMEKERRHRFQSATELAAMLEDLADQSEAQEPETAVLERAAPPSAAQQTLTGGTTAKVYLELRGGRLQRPRFGAALTSSYELILRNSTTETIGLNLRVTEGEDTCNISAPSRVTLSPFAQTSVHLAVTSKHRRWRGPQQWLQFAIEVIDERGGPPVTVSGVFDERPDRFMIYAAGALASSLILATILGILPTPERAASQVAASPANTGATVEAPVTRAAPISILLDGSHGGPLAAASLLFDEASTVTPVTTDLATARLSDVDVVIIPCPGDAELSRDELVALDRFVSGGGGLLLLGDGVCSDGFGTLGETFSVDSVTASLVAADGGGAFISQDVIPHEITDGLSTVNASGAVGLRAGVLWQELVRASAGVHDGAASASETAGPYPILVARTYGAGRIVAIGDDLAFNAESAPWELRNRVLNWLGQQ